jgi:RNA polymerase sigma factor (sigma-70 family)
MPAPVRGHLQSSGAQTRIDDRMREAARPAPGAARSAAMTFAVSNSPADTARGQEVAAMVRAAAAGDRAGWEGLVQQFSGMVWAVARAHRLGEANAGDVVQVTWLKLIEHLSDLKEPTRVGAWLATTARRECLRVLRGAKREVLVGEELPPLEATFGPAHDELWISERDAALWRTFSRLRPSDQALLRLLMADPQPPYEEIAAALDMPVGSIGPTRGRALDRLRQELGRDGTLTLLSTQED